MSFQNIDEIEDALKSRELGVRDLYTMWEQRQPVPEAVRSKDSRGQRADAPRVPWLQSNFSLARRFTARALDKEEFLLVCDAAREALRLWPEANEDERTELVRVRMNYAAALTRLGFTHDARREILPCVHEAFQPRLGRALRTDLFLQLGDILREESHHASATAARLQTAEEALGFYKRALQLEPDRLQALVLTAAALLIISEAGSALRSEAEEKARQILALSARLEETNGPRLQTTRARATAQTILGDTDAAAQSYAQLQTMDGVTTAQLAEARFYSQFLAESLGKPRDFFKQAFPPLQLIVFAGHMPDLPDHPARFPNESVEAVSESLREKLDQLQARVGLVSASAGADLLFIEALRARKGEFHLVLPWSKEEFRRTSVEPFEPVGRGPLWEPLFEKAVEKAATVRELGQVYEPGGVVGWEYLTEVTAGIALHAARASRLDIQPMVLWDGRPGRGAGGTESFVGFWRHYLQQEPIIVLPPKVKAAEGKPSMPRRVSRSERPTMHQEVKSMLFADIVGYSKLTEQVIPEFVETFMGRISQLAASSRYAPRNINTWGDAVYAVFDFAHEAGLFALEITQMIQEGRPDWLQKGLYWEEHRAENEEPIKHTLNIRIGLHTGPVVVHYNPVVRSLGFTGAHVNRAARIEPVAKPGEVFASEEFAALAELGAEIERRAPNNDYSSEANTGFVCEYAGSMQLAKAYPGRFRIYRVLPKRVFAIEELAKAAHEGYCAESKARGDTPMTNSSLRAWEELPEDLRAANRAQVADIPNKLHMIGYELAPSHGLRPSEIKLTDAQIDELAIREHDRWMSDRRRHGWTYAPRRDNARKQHPLLVPWDQLSEPEKEKDRDTIRNLPRLIERAGFRVRPA